MWKDGKHTDLAVACGNSASTDMESFEAVVGPKPHDARIIFMYKCTSTKPGATAGGEAWREETEVRTDGLALSLVITMQMTAL